LRGILHGHPVRRPPGHVVEAVDHENQVVLPEGVCIDDAVVQLVQQLLVLEARLPHLVQELLSPAFPLLRQGKFDILQRSPDAPGQSLFEQLQIFKALLLRQSQKIFLKFQLFRLLVVHIAAADAAAAAVLHAEQLSDRQNVFFYHDVSPFSVISAARAPAPFKYSIMPMWMVQASRSWYSSSASRLASAQLLRKPHSTITTGLSTWSRR